MSSQKLGLEIERGQYAGRRLSKGYFAEPVSQGELEKATFQYQSLTDGMLYLHMNNWPVVFKRYFLPQTLPKGLPQGNLPLDLQPLDVQRARQLNLAYNEATKFKQHLITPTSPVIVLKCETYNVFILFDSAVRNLFSNIPEKSNFKWKLSSTAFEKLGIKRWISYNESFEQLYYCDIPIVLPSNKPFEPTFLRDLRESLPFDARCRLPDYVAFLQYKEQASSQATKPQGSQAIALPTTHLNRVGGTLQLKASVPTHQYWVFWTSEALRPKDKKIPTNGKSRRPQKPYGGRKGATPLSPPGHGTPSPKTTITPGHMPNSNLSKGHRQRQIATRQPGGNGVQEVGGPQHSRRRWDPIRPYSSTHRAN